MTDKRNVPPFKPVFGALNPALIYKPKNAEEFIANAQEVLDRSPTTPLDRQILRDAIAKVKSRELALGDWPCIDIYLQIAKLAQNLDPNDLY